jgi:hypothetical protein
MLPTNATLDEDTLMAILDSGHSRIPVHKPGRRCEHIPHVLRAARFIVLTDVYYHMLGHKQRVGHRGQIVEFRVWVTWFGRRHARLLIHASTL